MPVVGFLSGGSSEGLSRPLVAFRQGLGESGYFESKNVTIEYRWANGQYDQLPTLVANLLRRQVTVIAPTTPVAALAAKQATTLIPIVFALGSDPVKDGLVLSLNRPGGNVTGATFFGNLLAAKRAELLHQLVADAKVFAVLLNPKNANVELEKSDTQQAVHALGLDLVWVKPVPKMRSISRLPISRAQLPFSSAAMYAFTIDASRSRNWRSAMRLPRAFHTASRPWQAG